MSGEGRETAAAAAGRGGSGGGEVMKKKEKAKKGSPPDEMEALIPISPGTLPSSRSMSPRPPPRPPSSTTTGPQHPQNGSSALDPIQRQKIRQLRLQAAKAARSKERGCQRGNIGRQLLWLTRAVLWLTAIFSLTILIVSFPLAVDPAFDTIRRAFSERPLICLTTDVQVHHSRHRNGTARQDDRCIWTSCRAGCTGELFRCVQLYANVSKLTWDVLEGANSSGWIPWLHHSSDGPTSKPRPKRADTSTSNWAVNWALSSDWKLSDRPSNKTQSVHRSGSQAASHWAVDRIQQDFYRNQFLRLLDQLNQSGLREEPFAAIHARLMINVRGCSYTADCSDFNRTAGVVGSLVPCHLSSQGDYEVGVVDHKPDQDDFIIFYLFVLPAVLFSSATCLLCSIQHHKCCFRPCRHSCCCRRDQDSAVEFSAARLIINSGQLGGRLPSLQTQSLRYVTTATEDDAQSADDVPVAELHRPGSITPSSSSSSSS